MEFLNEEFEQILNIFREESEEILDRINANLLKLEKNPSDKECISQLFRDAHSLKGASRMVGFVSIQNIAHKIEDILGLCKENKLEITTAVGNILFKSVDFLWLLVKNSIQLKSDYSTNEMTFYQNALQNVIDNASSTQIETPAKKVFNTTFYKNIENINACIIEINYVIDKPVDNEDKIVAIKELYEKLSENFSETDYYDIKQLIQDIIAKLNFVLSASGVLTEEEITEIKTTTASIIEHYKQLLKMHDYQDNVDFYNYKVNSANTEEIKNNSTPKNDALADAFSVLKDEFSKFDTNNANISLISTNLNVLAYEIKNEDIKKICTKLNNLLETLSEKQIAFDAEYTSILKQILKSLENIILTSKEIQREDISLLEQRLTILFQILDLETIKNDVTTDKTSKGNLTKFQADKLQKITDNAQKNDYFSNIEAVAIKTLRVDSQKLDNLANSISELIIQKIKLSAHTNSIIEISNQINELKTFVNKSVNYIKYYESKLAEDAQSKESKQDIVNLQGFQKHIVYLLQEINNKNNNIFDSISHLYDTILEDGNKHAQILDNIEETIKEVRILPLATIFHMFPRMVRDISYENGKDIELEIIGNETSVDKKIVEEIKIPLIHILRNSIDHGIETPDERRKLNKPATGKIKINAFHEYNKIVIEISDDGRGIDIEKVRNKALQKGLLSEEEINSMTDEQIMNIIFYPGFSTEDIVTELSGRGVGLDIVQTKIGQLNGKVKISSVANKGSVVRLELPITTATINTFIFKINQNYFAIPVDIVSSLYLIKATDIKVKSNKEFIIVNDETIPIFRISDIMGVEENTQDTQRFTVMVVQTDNAKIGYIIQNLIGDEEVILRKFVPPLFNITNIAGITTLVNGSTCLILNMQDIIKNTISKKHVTLTANSLQKLPQEKTLPKILVLDDSATTRNLLKNILEAKYQTEIAPLPSIATELISRIKFDLIITDIEMPEMNGIEFIERVKKQPLNSDTPVMVFSSFSSEDIVNQATNLGVKHYFTKNEFNQNVFLTVVDEILSDKF